MDKNYLLLLRWSTGSGFLTEDADITHDRDKAERFTLEQANWLRDNRDLDTADSSSQLVYVGN